MGLEQACEQLEFPFLQEMRLRLYAKHQVEDMKTLWNVAYRYDGDYGKEMRFGDFIARVWIPGKYAERFHNNWHRQYYYDSPDYAKIYAGKR